MRVEGGVELVQRPFVVTDALARVIFLFEMEHRRLRSIWGSVLAKIDAKSEWFRISTSGWKLYQMQQTGLDLNIVLYLPYRIF